MLTESADRVYKKIQAEGKVAVFIVDGKVKTVGINNADYQSRMNGTLTKLLGVYTDAVGEKDLFDDLAWAGAHMSS